jgi:hypothetical protein
MMSMFTFVVVMLTIGVAIQRFDVLEEYFGKGKVALEYRRDEAIVRANTLSNIDVLANDLGLKDGDADDLVIVVQPKCGRVFARDGQAQYLPAERCVGSQTFKYAVSGRDRGKTGEVIVVVRIGEPKQTEVAADAQRDVPAQAPMAPPASEQRVDETPALLAEQSRSGADSGGGIVPAPVVPRPAATAIAGLPDTASGAGSAAGVNDSVAAGVTLDGSGRVPSLTAPSGGLSQSSELSGPPVVPQSDQDAPDQSTSGLPEPVQPDSGQPAGRESGGTAPSALAPVDPVATGAPEADGAAAPLIQREAGGLDVDVPRAGPADIGSGGTGQAGFAAPADALASVRELGDTAELAPVDTTPPAVLTDPNATPGTAARQSGDEPPETHEPPVASVAVLPEPAVPCTVLPVLTLDIRPAGITEVIIDSPCHANSAAELSYETLHFGIALDAAGSGSIAAVGFQQASDATLRFTDGQGIAFNIPFVDTERMDRVALVWDLPIALELHAFEFGARPGSPDHVRAKNPRGHGDVRRTGGGYLLGYQPVNGVGQHVEVYTYWHRNGGKAGVVQLKLGIDSARGAAGSEACGDGALAQPDFKTLRAVAGRLERPRLHRLAPLDCDTVAGMTNRYISDAVDDLIVLQR